MTTTPTAATARHYDRLDRFYRRLWGEHLHHGLWADPAWPAERAVRHLVHQVARDARMREGARVVDIGCGYGAPARLWAEAYGADVIGYTVSAAQHAYAERRAVSTGGPQPTFLLRDITDNGLPDGAADAVVAIESLTHMENPPAVLREARRLLRPGGRLVACVWMAAPDPPKWARRHLLEPIRRDGRLSILPTAPQLRRWGGDAGLVLDEITDRTAQVRRTWTVVLRRVGRALLTDMDLWRTLLDPGESERAFAGTIPRIWIAQRLGVLRYGWLVARAPTVGTS